MEATRTGRSLKLPARASLWYIFSSVVARGAGVVGTPIFTRLLSPEDYGVYPIYVSWLSIFGALATLELSGGVIYRAMQKYGERRNEVISATLGLTLSSSLIFSLLYALFYQRLNRLTGLGLPLTATLLSQILINIPLSLYTAECRYAYRYRGVVLINLTSAILTPITAILIIRLTSLGAVARIIAMLAVGILTSFPALLRILKRCKRLYSGEIWRYLLHTGLSLLPHHLSVVLILRIGEIAVSRAFSREELGKYAVATSVGLGLTVLSSGLSSALSPWILRKLGAGEEKRISSLLLTVMEGLGLATLLFLCYAPEAMAVIAPEEYRDALGAVYPIALSLTPMLLSGAVSSCEIFYDRGVAVSRNSLLAVAAGVLASLLAVRLGDYRLAGFAQLAAYIALLGLGVWDMRRLGVFPIRIRETVGALAVLFIYATVAYLLRESFSSRLLLSIPTLLPLIAVGRRAYAEIRE